MSLTPARLRRLVRYRERLERLQGVRVGQALAAERLRAGALAAAEAGRASLLDQPPAFDPADGEARLAYLRRADREVAARTAALAHSKAEVARERELLLDRRQARLGMETLLEKAVEAERLERQRREMKQLDDVAGRAWARQAAEEGGRNGG